MPVEIHGLREFRRDLRRADPELAKTFRRELKAIAETVAAEAAAIAPKRTGKLAGSYRGVTVGSKGVVRSRLLYARFIEFGFHPRGSSTFVEGRNVVGQALEHQEDRIVDALGDAIESTATRLGWH